MMVDQASSLTKTCSICGQTKPLSAFLEVSGPEGTRYGNVCANCRKTQPEPDLEEGTRRQVGGARIGSDERVVSESDKDDQRKKIRRDYDEDRKFTSDLFNQRSQTIQKKTEFDRRRREGTLGKSMFDEKRPVKADENSFAAEQTREAEINLAAPIEDTRVAKEKRKSSSVWAQFQSWVGAAAPVNKQRSETKIAEHRKDESKPESPAVTSERADSIVDYADKNLPEGTRPSSGRRRS